MGFQDRVERLPHLGIGVSTEYGAARSEGALDVLALRRRHPGVARFLEVGVEVEKGLDDDARAWVEAGGLTTYHFLDLNLDDPDDFDDDWLDEVRHLVGAIRPAWLCGDAGLWHFGRRERGQMTLLPPVLTPAAADAMAEGIVRLREETGREVLPENPPGVAYLGEMHLLDFYARVCDRADTGLLLDCAHLAIYQRISGHRPWDGLDGFPVDRVVEIHVAGGTENEHEGFAFVEDDHTTALLPETWDLVDRVAARATALRAVVLECERNGLDDVLPLFAEARRRLAGTSFAQRGAA